MVIHWKLNKLHPYVQCLQQDSCCDRKWQKRPQRGLVLQTIRPTHTYTRKGTQQQREHSIHSQLLGLEVTQIDRITARVDWA
eukprot:11962812-Ditylum_brightwellii.AAC.1